MLLLLILELALYLLSVNCQKVPLNLDDRESAECHNRIYRNCNHETYFTNEEIDRARLYMQNRFFTESSIKPVKPACSKLYVRRDFKCLTHAERIAVIDVFKELYRTGIMDKFAYIHSLYWPATHKFTEALIWHRWFLNEFEKEMRKINSDVSLPYWESAVDFAAPEKSIIFDYFGHAGTEDNDYCVSDGPFANQTVANPKPHCLRRQWNALMKVSNLEPPEWITSAIQMSDSWGELGQLGGLNFHFKTHLAIGGYAGDMSITVAPNDPLFYLYHNYQIDYVVLKWQFSDHKFLVPESYQGFKFDSNSQRIGFTNIQTDRLTYYSNIFVKEVFQVGFGDLCWIPDQFIKPINSLLQKQTIELPITVNRLPKSLFAIYFPKFFTGNSDFFDYVLPDIGNCNRHSLRQICKSMPLTQPFFSTANGRRQLERFRFDAQFDISTATLLGESIYYNFMTDMLTLQYCSPYI